MFFSMDVKVTPVYGTNCIHDEDTMMNGIDTGIGGALFAYVPNVDNTVHGCTWGKKICP